MPDTRTAYSYFRITAALGIVTDMTLNPQTLGYEPVHDKLGQGYRTCSTEWYSTQGSVPEQELRLALMAESEGVTQQTTSERVTLSDPLTAAHTPTAAETCNCISCFLYRCTVNMIWRNVNYFL
jgi:hypothetical protein